MLNALILMALVLGVLLSLMTAFDADVPRRLGRDIENSSRMSLMAMLAIAAVCLALGPGPPELPAGFSKAFRAIEQTNGVTMQYFAISP